MRKFIVLIILFCVGNIAVINSSDARESYSETLQLAEQGDSMAQVRLGDIYYHGDGVKQDYNEALMWYKKAAEQGFAVAQHILGIIYHSGSSGVRQDYKKAFSWTKKAAEQGDAEAQYGLGGMYKNGEGVKQDYIYSYVWFDMASHSGDSLVVLGANSERSRVANKMTASQIEKAQDLAKECIRKEYKDC